MKSLKPIAAGDTVRMRLPGEKRWSQGVCTGLVGPRSYGVRVGESRFVRNRRQLIRSDEQPMMPSPPELDELPLPSASSSTAHSDGTTDLSESSSSPVDEPTVDSPPPEPRRSTRNRKPPDWITTYVPS